MTGPAKNLLQMAKWAQSPEARAAGLDIKFSIATFCRAPDNGDMNVFVQTSRREGLDTHIIPESRAFDLDILPRTRQLVEKLQPDIVQTHNVKSGFVFGRVRSSSTRWIAFQHGYTATDFKIRLYNQLDRWTLPRADRVVTVCQAFVPKLQSFGVRRERVHVLHNSILPIPRQPEEKRLQMRQDLGISPDHQVIMTIGRLSKEKGHRDLLNALAKLQDLAPSLPWKMVIIGTGPEELHLRQMSAALKIQDRVILAGFRSPVAPFYSIADIFVLPSHSEGSPNVLLESMAAGVPVVATRAGGTPEIATDEQTGLLVEVGDSAAMADRLHCLLLDKDLCARLSAAAYQDMLDRFAPQHYRASLLNIYASATGLPFNADPQRFLAKS